MLVLVSGTVVVERDGVPFARIEHPGAVFGEMSAVLDRPATATVRVVGEVRFRVVADPLDFLTENPGAALSVLQTTGFPAGRAHPLPRGRQAAVRREEGHFGLVDESSTGSSITRSRRRVTGSARDPRGFRPQITARRQTQRYDSR